MTYCRKVPLKKLFWKTSGDLGRHICSTFQGLSPSSEQISIIFDIYLDRSIRKGKRNRRNRDDVDEATILQLKKLLLLKVEKFWGSSRNKMQLGLIFIEWIIKFYKGSRLLLFGGDNKEIITSCVTIANGEVSLQSILKCDHEETDDWLLLHANHVLKINNHKKMIIASPKTCLSQFSTLPFLLDVLWSSRTMGAKWKKSIAEVSYLCPWRIRYFHNFLMLLSLSMQ